MTALHDYNPLESLLLFQSLVAYGVQEESFIHISESLRKSTLIHDAAAERLNPASLQQLYLRLLKDEAKQELQDALDREDDANTDTPAPRKRKAPSPSLPTVQEASRHLHLVPQLVAKLYSRYQEHVVREIREEEQIYDQLVGKLDRHKGVPNGVPSPKPTPEPKHEPATDDGDGADSTGAEAVAASTAPDTHDAAKPQSNEVDAKGAPLPAKSTSPPSHSSAKPAAPESKFPASTPATLPSVVEQKRDRSGAPSTQQTPTLPTHPSRRPEIAVVPPPKGGYQLPPFQLGPQAAATTQHQARIPSPAAPRPPGRPGVGVPSIDLPPRLSSEQLNLANTPERVYNRPGVVITPGSSTHWKFDPQTPPVGPVQRPRSKSISPISDQETSPKPPKPTGARRGRPSAVSRLSGISTRPKDADEGSIAGPRSAKGPRAGSRTSSTRSQSIAPPSEETPPISRGRRPGRAQPSTPAADDGDHMDTASTPSEAPPPTTSTSTISKRKRHSPSPSPSAAVPATPAKLTHVLANRNFAKMTKDIMNSITSHKYASLFANPIREKQAEGYAEIIRRPQDLKSIRAMIGFGSRTVAAMVAADPTLLSVSSPGPGTPIGAGAGASVVAGSGSSLSVLSLPLSADLVPPRAIVNADQFEKEIMRMFANAVMFNPGEEDLVTETREMFDTVQAELARWRETERTLGAHFSSHFYAASAATPAAGAAVAAAGAAASGLSTTNALASATTGPGSTASSEQNPHTPHPRPAAALSASRHDGDLDELAADEDDGGATTVGKRRRLG